MIFSSYHEIKIKLQQHLPFTVLKRANIDDYCPGDDITLQQHLPFTVLKQKQLVVAMTVATVVATTPTVYGIETLPLADHKLPYVDKLQQHLPFTVLKLK